jgi:calmodulin
VICVDELKFILSNLPVKVSTQEIEEMIKAADIDGDGKIDFQEFRKMIGQ